MALPTSNITQTTFIPKGSIEHIVVDRTNLHTGFSSSIHLMGNSTLVSPYLVVRGDGYSYHVVLMVRSGRLLFRRSLHGPDEEYGTGTMLFLPADSWYIYGADAELKLVWFHLRKEALEWNFLEYMPMFSSVVPDMDTYVTLVKIQYARQDSRDEIDTGIVFYARKLVEQCFLRLLRNNVTASPMLLKLQSLFNTVKISMDKDWDVETMARFCHLSVSALFKASQQYLKQSPIKYLNELRIKESANLLLYTNYKLDLIASIVGFSCGFSLSRAFRKHFGVSPKFYKSSGGKLSEKGMGNLCL
ncbi:MAG: helix-turn-helix transcriptional regulator [Lentisphaeria bacterium]